MPTPLIRRRLATLAVACSLAATQVSVAVAEPVAVRSGMSTSSAVGTAPRARAVDARAGVAQASDARAIDSRPGRWSWPVLPRPAVVRSFDPPAKNWLAGHRGVDLAAAPDTPVLSTDDGVVTHVGVIAGRGTVTVTHANGLRSTYQPIDALVIRGDHLTRGQPLGTLSATGSHCDPAACLHLGAIRGETYLDPLTLLLRPRIILLPLRE